MQTALYLIPVTLGSTPLSKVLPDYNTTIICSIKYFIVENIRSAKRFLSSVSKDINMESLVFFELNEHTPPSQVFSYIKPLEDGFSMGIISEAGCPAVADPGASAVAVAQKKGIPVVPLVGPSSILLALMSSGFNGQNFSFTGYLPIKKEERAARIKKLEARAWQEKQTQLFIEAPYRNTQLFEALISVCKKETLLCVASGITTENEYIKTKSIAEWKAEGRLPPFGKIPCMFLISC